MIYPSFLKKNDTIGICAPSAGVGKKLESFEQSLSKLKQEGYNILETKNVRIFNERGGTAQERGAELNSLFENDSVNFVMAAAGGDFLDEMLPYISFQTLQQHPKWLMGASDPTSILYPYTTMCDVATLYGCNAGSFDIVPLPDYLQTCLAFIQGNLLEQTSYKAYQNAKPWEVEGYQPDTPSHWQATVENLSVSGRCIGGCIDSLKDIIGTKFDTTHTFIEKYKDDGFIWYFDNFALSAENLYRTLLQMQFAGWFENTKAIIIGRTLLPSSETGMEYEEAIHRAFQTIPVLYNADIGHTNPSMTMINGAILHLQYTNTSASLKFECK